MSKSIGVTPPVHLAHVTEMNAQYSPLLRLPAELRNQIYDYIFEAVRVKVHNSAAPPEKHTPPHACLLARRDAKARFGIPSTCRQLYAETAGLSHGSVVYEFMHLAKLTAWTRTSPPHMRARVKEISFRAGLDWCYRGHGGLLFYCWMNKICGLGRLVEACRLLRDLECVHLALGASLYLPKAVFAVAVGNLKEKLTKPDGRKAEVVVRYVDIQEALAWTFSC